MLASNNIITYENPKIEILREIVACCLDYLSRNINVKFPNNKQQLTLIHWPQTRKNILVPFSQNGEHVTDDIAITVWPKLAHDNVCWKNLECWRVGLYTLNPLIHSTKLRTRETLYRRCHGHTHRLPQITANRRNICIPYKYFPRSGNRTWENRTWPNSYHDTQRCHGSSSATKAV